MSQGYLLVLDDNAGIRHLLNELLTQKGYTVETAENRMECLSKIHADELDLVIWDYRILCKGGSEIVTELKRGNPNLPIIMITTNLEMTCINEGLINGSINNYLTKPFDLDEVCYLVKILVNKRIEIDNRNYDNDRVCNAISL